MKNKCCAVLWFFLLFLPCTSGAESRLLQQDDFTYLGAFRVPKSDMGGPLYQGLSYGGSVIVYNRAHNSLFIVGHGHNQQVGEISIPEIINSPNVSELNTASVVQNLADITEGNLANLGIDGGLIGNGARIGGLLVYGNYLIGSSYAYYDGGQNAIRSHFKSSLIMAVDDDFEGMYEVGNKPSSVPQAGFVGGYMTPIPSDWQTELGGKVLTGMSTLSILSRTSSGPAAFAFDPDQLGATPAPAAAALYYPIDHQTIGTYQTSQTLYNSGSHQSGIVFPAYTRSILYTGRQGLGNVCYGPGTNIEDEQGNRYDTPYPGNLCMGEPMSNTQDPCCYDPVNLNKGPHAYPYADYVWAYDAEDLARVKNGGRIIDDPSPNLVDGVSASSTETYMPWDIKPYAHWALDFPYTQASSTVFSGASAYDEVTNRLFVVQALVDDDSWPIVHVYKLNIDSSASKTFSLLLQIPSILPRGVREE